MSDFILENEWLRAEFNPRGAAITRLIYKPLNQDVLLQSTDPTAPFSYVNTVVGPIANRVENGRFQINGERVQLDQNEGVNSLHGGVHGLSECDWVGEQTHDRVAFKITTDNTPTPHDATASYAAIYNLEGAALRIELRALCDQDAAFNLAPHLYFTLGTTDISQIKLSINADHYLPIDGATMPTGEIAPVANTAFDFTTPSPIGNTWLDHNFCLNDGTWAAVLSFDGLEARVITESTGIQVYDAAHLNRSAVAIEPQGWPNAVNQPTFPNQFCKANNQWVAVSTVSFQHASN